MQVVEETTAAGVDALIYCHPIGDHMHGAGATIGLSDMDNQPVPVKGDVKVLADSWCVRFLHWNPQTLWKLHLL